MFSDDDSDEDDFLSQFAKKSTKKTESSAKDKLFDVSNLPYHLLLSPPCFRLAFVPHPLTKLLACNCGLQFDDDDEDEAELFQGFKISDDKPAGGKETEKKQEAEKPKSPPAKEAEAKGAKEPAVKAKNNAKGKDAEPKAAKESSPPMTRSRARQAAKKATSDGSSTSTAKDGSKKAKPVKGSFSEAALKDQVRLYRCLRASGAATNGDKGTCFAPLLAFFLAFSLSLF